MPRDFLNVSAVERMDGLRIRIDNLDGRGAVDFTETVLPEGPVTVTRRLNAASTCTVELMPGVLGLPVPVRRARVVVTAEDGSTLFTGYIATEPARVYAGESTAGAVCSVRVSGVSDEWLLDRLGPTSSATGLSQDAGELLRQLTSRVQSGSGTLAVEAAGTLRTTGVIASSETASWSENAQLAANAGYAGYRVLGGQVAVQPVGAVVHALSDGDGTLNPGALRLAAVRELANDVTVSGEEEPAAFVAETFEADGATAQFVLSDPAFQGAQRSLLWDPFEEAVLSEARWTVSDPGGHLALGGGGLTFNGGTRADGQTTVSATNAVEMGGTLVVELGGVLLGAASDGVLGGFYSGQKVLANCFAGFRVRQSVSATGNETLLVGLVNGAEVGSPFTVVEGQAYTLRLRLHCPEMYRFAQPYYCMADGAVQGFGSSTAATAPMHALLELVGESASSNAAATVLFDSAAAGAEIEGSPAQCSFAVANAVQMFGSVRSVRVERPGSLWVVSTLPDGTEVTRLTGVAGEGVDCEVRYGSAAGTPGSVLFSAGSVPMAGERVTVFYRGQRRAVARLADAASLASEAVGAGSSAGTSRWLGKVLAPPARTSADCESAAQAVLAMATSRSAAMAGEYALVNPVADVWPGDVLSVTSEGVETALLVRNVVVMDGGAVPEVRRYQVSFANDWATEWADGLGLKLSDRIAADAVLPLTAASGTAEVLANLPQLRVLSLTGGSLQVDAGAEAPAGGGFEVRRRDWVFGPGASGPDLVLRSPVRNFGIVRATQSERFYVRMYDGSSPPVYSRFSSAVFVHAPIA